MAGKGGDAPWGVTFVYTVSITLMSFPFCAKSLFIQFRLEAASVVRRTLPPRHGNSRSGKLDFELLIVEATVMALLLVELGFIWNCSEKEGFQRKSRKDAKKKGGQIEMAR